MQTTRQQRVLRLTPAVLLLSWVMLTAGANLSHAQTTTDNDAPNNPSKPTTTQSTTNTKTQSGAGIVIDETTIAALDAESWPIRETATLRLLRDESLTPDSIAKALGQPLSPEQRLRLMLVAEHHVIRLMGQRLVTQPGKASLGVALEWLVPEEVAELGRPGARVEATLPGFPAYGVLQLGDLIVALNGQGIDPSIMGEAMVQVLRDMIQTHSSGDVVELTIVRDALMQQIKVKLGSLDAMRTLYEPDTLTLQPAALVELRRFQQSLKKPQPVENSNR